MQKYGIGCLVTDTSALKVPKGWVDDVAKLLPKNISFYQVFLCNGLLNLMLTALRSTLTTSFPFGWLRIERSVLPSRSGRKCTNCCRSTLLK